MSARYPAGSWEPLGRQTEDRMTSHDIICVHTMVGSLLGTDSMFERDGFGGTESHFGTGGAGERVKQWQDLAFTADANLNGNPRVISIENADKGPGFPAWSGSNVPAFTAKQLDQLVDLVAWLCSKEAHAACPTTWKCHQVGIPAVMIPDSKPGRRGIGYHRQGIDGSLPDMRVAGGDLWSSSRGKICPGDRRVRQIREQLVPRVAARIAKRELRGGTFNLLVGRDPDVVAAEVTALLDKHDLDFLVVEEATAYKRALRAIPGYRYLVGQSTNGGAQSEVGILVRDGVKVDWYANAAYGDGWLKAPRFIARMQPRVLPRVTLNGWLRVCGVHMPAAVNLRTCEPPDRFDDYVALMKKVGEFLSSGRRARIAVGDWNQLRDNTRTHSPRWTAEHSGAVLVSPDRRIDYVLAARCVVDPIHKDFEIPEASDHEPVVFVVRKR